VIDEIYLVTLKRLDVTSRRRRGIQLPHLNSLVQARTEELARVWGERNAVDGIKMTLKAMEEVARPDVPYSDTFVKRARCYKFGVRGYSNRCDSILNGEYQTGGTCL
jgi:hypothetical protein